MKIIAFLLVTILIISCNQPVIPVGQKIEEEFDLHYGQSTQIQYRDEFIIKFQEVVEDSRCPIDVDCVWEGNAKIILTITQKDYILNSTLEPTEIYFSGKEGIQYRIKLISVSPYPKSEEKIILKNYSVRLIVFTNEIW